jgi:hypothetical protein
VQSHVLVVTVIRLTLVLQAGKHRRGIRLDGVAWDHRPEYINIGFQSHQIVRHNTRRGRSGLYVIACCSLDANYATWVIWGTEGELC